MVRIGRGPCQLPDLVLQVQQTVAGSLNTLIAVLHRLAVMGLKGCKPVHQRIDTRLDKNIIKDKKIAFALGHLLAARDN